MKMVIDSVGKLNLVKCITGLILVTTVTVYTRQKINKQSNACSNGIRNKCKQ